MSPTQPYHHSQTPMRKLSSSLKSQILSLLAAGVSGHEISKETGVSIGAISKLRSEHYPNLPRSSGGRPCILSTANIDYARRMIKMGKIDNATQAAKALQDITNKPFSAHFLCQNLKEAGCGL